MSKRNRSKKKKQKILKKIQEYRVPEQQVEVQAEKTADIPKIKVEDTSIIDEKTRKFISRDVKIILITLLVLTLILVVIKILQTRTDIIDNFSNWLVQILNINTN